MKINKKTVKATKKLAEEFVFVYDVTSVVIDRRDLE